jgi:uncharacterized RDD family membrane protein YckC
MVAQAPPAPAVTAVRVPYAGIATRAVALAIDAVIVQGAILIVAGVLALVGLLVGGIDLGTAAKVVAGAVWLLATGGYFVAFWTADGQTPGMRAMHLRVATARGMLPGVGRSTLRVVFLGLCILTLFVGFLPVLFDNRRRGAHDMLVGTVVAYDDAS